MKFIRQSRREHPRVSLILLDWSVRESFHLLHYLERQDVPRDDFEVLIVEYYSRVSDAIRKFEDQVDGWLLLEMPEDCYYHKHLMYNAGIAIARGNVCVICDSDAMVKPGFIRTIAEAFERDPDLVLHLDQFRNNRRDFYPFNYPSFEQVAGDGCINNVSGRTSGVLDTVDPIHTRNYGACMCARRDDLIAIGGADEHVDFVGHICGPYDMTFRLVNSGKREIWHDTEFLFHTWHPGQAGVDNYLGPHDGRHVSTTALAALASRRVRPLLESPAIRRLREAPGTPVDDLMPLLIRPEGPAEWRRAALEAGRVEARFDASDLHVGYYRGYSVYRDGRGFYAHLAVDPHRGRESAGGAGTIEGETLARVRAEIDARTPGTTAITIALAYAFVTAWQLAHFAKRRLIRRRRPGEAGPSAPPTGMRFSLRLKQFRTECRNIVESLAHLVPNLRRLRDQAQAAPAARVVIGDRRTEVYLKMLRALRVIPPVRLDRAGPGEQVEHIVAESADRAHPERLVLASGVYYCCYPSLARRHLERAFSVI